MSGLMKIDSSALFWLKVTIEQVAKIVKKNRTILNSSLSTSKQFKSATLLPTAF